MRVKIIALRDIKTNIYKPTMFVNNINVAIRDLRDMVNDQDTSRPKEDWQRHPEDFELWELGEWETETGQFFVEVDTEQDDWTNKQLLALSTLKG